MRSRNVPIKRHVTRHMIKSNDSVQVLGNQRDGWESVQECVRPRSVSERIHPEWGIVLRAEREPHLALCVLPCGEYVDLCLPKLVPYLIDQIGVQSPVSWLGTPPSTLCLPLCSGHRGCSASECSVRIV
ncbi:unnamed protein product [Arctogadus glacialis]